MSSRFVKQSDIVQEQFDWGVIGWRCVPETGAKQLVVMDVTLEPGEGHDFHRHPGQEEMIIVKQGRITQYLEQESTPLGRRTRCSSRRASSTRRSTTATSPRCCRS